MKSLIIAIAALSLVSCTTVQLGQIDAAIQKTAPVVCEGAVTAHDAFVATGLGGANEKAIVAAAWEKIAPLCAAPSKITATQLTIVSAQVGVIIYTMRKVKASG